MPKNIYRKGLTLIELLIAISMASVVFIIVGSILAAFVTQNSKSQRQEMFEQAKNDLSQELSNNIRWGSEIVLSENMITVDGNEYKLENGYLQKNGQNLLTDRIRIKSFLAVDRSVKDQIVGADITIDMEDRNYPLASDVMHLVISQRVMEIIL